MDLKLKEGRARRKLCRIPPDLKPGFLCLLFVVLVSVSSVNGALRRKPVPTSRKDKRKTAPATRPAPQAKPPWQPNDSPFGVVLDMQSCKPKDLKQAVYGAYLLGFKLVRAVIPWAEIEPQPERFRFDPYDHLVYYARSYGMDVMLTLAFCPKWASSLSEDSAEVSARARPADLKMWSRYVKTTVYHFHNNVRFWQVWERPSIENFRGTTQDYMELLVAAHTAAKQADPNALIFAAEPGGPDLGFITALSEKSTVNSFEGIALCPQVDAPEKAAPYFDAVRKQILNTTTASNKRIFVTGWDSSSTQDVRRRSRIASGEEADAQSEREQRQQASTAVRAISVALTCGVSRVFWPQLLDSREDAREGRPAGLLDAEFHERLTAKALHNLLTFVPSKASFELHALGDTPARLVSLLSSGAERRALLWSAYSQTPLSSSGMPGIQLNPQTRIQRAMDGKIIDLEKERGESVRVQTEPLLLTGFDPLPAELNKTTTWFPPPPWRESVYLDFSEKKEDGGIYHRKYRAWNIARPEIVMEGRIRAAQLVPEGDRMNPFLYGDVDDGYIFFNKRLDKIAITVRASARDPNKQAGFNVMYDSPRGHVFSPWQWVQAGAGWKDYTIILSDAYFANKSGFDFRISSMGSKQDVFIARVTIQRLGLE